MNRNADAVSRLLAAGANPNAALLSGETVLMTCARAGDATAVRALLARGAQRQRQGIGARPDGADVGRRAIASAGRAGAARARRRRARPVARVRADGDQRSHAACRTRGVELHRAARRHDGAALRGAIGRRRIGAAAHRRRRRRERCPARRRQRAHRRRAQRSSSGGDGAARQRREPERQRASATRRSMPRCSGATSSW